MSRRHFWITSSATTPVQAIALPAPDQGGRPEITEVFTHGLQRPHQVLQSGINGHIIGVYAPNRTGETWKVALVCLMSKRVVWVHDTDATEAITMPQAGLVYTGGSHDVWRRIATGEQVGAAAGTLRLHTASNAKTAQHGNTRNEYVASASQARSEGVSVQLVSRMDGIVHVSPPTRVPTNKHPGDTTMDVRDETAPTVSLFPRARVGAVMIVSDGWGVTTYKLDAPGGVMAPPAVTIIRTATTQDLDEADGRARVAAYETLATTAASATECARIVWGDTVTIDQFDMSAGTESTHQSVIPRAHYGSLHHMAHGRYAMFADSKVCIHNVNAAHEGVAFEVKGQEGYSEHIQLVDAGAWWDRGKRARHHTPPRSVRAPPRMRRVSGIEALSMHTDESPSRE